MSFAVEWRWLRGWPLKRRRSPDGFMWTVRAPPAGWLVRRAVNIENVSSYSEGMVLYLPAGPRFRLEKEIKNVVTAIAKT